MAYQRHQRDQMVYEDQPMSIDTYYYVKDYLLSLCVFLINEFIYLSHATLISHNIHVVSGTKYICIAYWVYVRGDAV